MQPYDTDVEQHMRELYRSLSEKDRRRYAAVEAEKFGYGGTQYIAELFGCHPDTIRQGKADLQNLPEDAAEGRVRKKRGGRKKASTSQPGVVEAIQSEVETQTAGSPVEAGSIWTNIGLRDLAERLKALGFSLSAGVISNILRSTLEMGRRSIAKNVPFGSSEHRNEQFEKLAELRRLYESKDWPVVSVDTKKKELVGRFARSGQAWTDGTVRAYDHDFGSYGNDDKAVPYGVYDTVANEGFVYLATGSDTGEVAADALRRWWYRMGRKRYQGVGGLLVLADCGGSNGYRVALYRERLQQLATRLGLPIRVAHLPPYCSKYNPIDHRLFCHLSRAIRGRLVESLAWLQLLFSQVTTRSGLRVVCELARKSHVTGIKANQTFRENEPTQRDKDLGQFNYMFSL